ncbi:MAG TPA: ABC transporter permease [Candidatus Dormibacteraeota bacterium]|nr:ABC transporter permease [Candidatus Dormibacteraeota bacterium]
MTATAASRPWRSGTTWRNLLRDRPVIPLIGLLAILVVVIELADNGIVTPTWAGVIIRAAIPLAILGGCQTLAMLTGGIDLSVASIASMSGFVTATLIHSPGGVVQGIVVVVVASAIAGLINGVGIGVFRVHPLIMTLGMSFVVLGLANVWQLQTVQTGAGVPDSLRTLGSGTFASLVPHDLPASGTIAALADLLPFSLIVFVPVAAAILIGLRRTGYGRLLFAIGDNPIAARLSGARGWQVLIVLYVISAVLASIAGLLISGLTNTASVSLADSYLLPSVAAAVIGGTSIFGGRGGFGGTMVGALILTVLAALLTVLGLPEPSRLIVFGSIIVFVAAAYTRVTAES